MNSIASNVDQRFVMAIKSDDTRKCMLFNRLKTHNGSKLVPSRLGFCSCQAIAVSTIACHGGVYWEFYGAEGLGQIGRAMVVIIIMNFYFNYVYFTDRSPVRNQSKRHACSTMVVA